MESIILYGAEIWGCVRSLEFVEQVQLSGIPHVFGGKYLASQRVPLDMLPVIWEAKMRTSAFSFGM